MQTAAGPDHAVSPAGSNFWPLVFAAAAATALSSASLLARMATSSSGGA